jgi:eukaryotic-like serine/threonine-protein kinase
MPDVILPLSEALAQRYHIERELGAGGMAVVYLARDEKHGREVAVKVLRADVAASVGRERFLREIQLAAKLSHPHILPLHDSGEAKGTLYYVMPNVEGRSLRERLGNGPLPIDEAIRVAQDVASALDYAHRHGVVHRDVKPENIMLQDGHALVADFGIGKAVSDADADTLTQVGMSVGTPAYMSPEQAVGEPVDGRSDVYSLGCVLYEMLVGEPPFTGPNAQAVIAKRFVQTPADVSGLRDGVSRSVARLVQKSLARTPIDRFQTAGEMLVALRESDAAPAAAKAGPPAQSIAVLPFENLSADKENEYLGDGIAEEIINVLAQVDGLRVAARTSAFSFKGKHDDLRSIGGKLGVATVLEGSVRRAGARLRITAQLIDVSDGYHLWSERYDRELVDVFAVQDEIAAAIAAKLQVTFDKQAGGPRDRATPEQVEAFELFSKARDMLARRLGLEEAIAILERVVALDPMHARARVAIAEALRLLANFDRVPVAVAIPRAKQEIAKALAIDPSLGEAYAVLAVMTFAFDWNASAAIAHWRRALELNSVLSEARVMYADYGLVMGLGELELATTEALRAFEDDPRSTIVAALASQVLCMAGHYEQALAAAQRSVELDPQSITGLASLAVGHAMLGDCESARRASERAIQLSARIPLILSVAASVEAVCGEVRRADAYHRELLVRSEFEPVSHSALATTATAAGRLDEALEHALLGADAHELLAGFTLYAPWFAHLRSHPRFGEVRERLRR